MPALLLPLPFSAPCTQLQSCPEQPLSALQDQPAIRCAAEGCWDAERYVRVGADTVAPMEHAIKFGRELSKLNI